MRRFSVEVDQVREFLLRCIDVGIDMGIRGDAFPLVMHAAAEMALVASGIEIEDMRTSRDRAAHERYKGRPRPIRPGQVVEPDDGSEFEEDDE